MCVPVYLKLGSHFLPIKIHLTSISPILVKMIDFKNLAWATSFATPASRKFIYLPYRVTGEKSYCDNLLNYNERLTSLYCWFYLLFFQHFMYWIVFEVGLIQFCSATDSDI